MAYGRYSSRYARDTSRYGTHSGITQEWRSVPLQVFLTQHPDGPHNSTWSRMWDEMDRGGGFYEGHRLSTFSHDAARFTMPQEARNLRDSMAEDLPNLATAQRRKRVVNRKRGRAICDMTAAALAMRGEAVAPTFWKDSIREEQPHRGMITVLVNTALRGDQSNAEMLWRGAAALAVTDLLETLGYSVRLIMARRTKIGSHTVQASVILKEAGETCSEASMAIICDAGFQRLAWWQWLGSQRDVNLSSVGGSYNAEGVDADFVIPHELYDQADADRWVRDVISRAREGLDPEGEE